MVLYPYISLIIKYNMWAEKWFSMRPALPNEEKCIVDLWQKDTCKVPSKKLEVLNNSSKNELTMLSEEVEVKDNKVKDKKVKSIKFSEILGVDIAGKAIILKAQPKEWVTSLIERSWLSKHLTYTDINSIGIALADKIWNNWDIQINDSIKISWKLFSNNTLKISLLNPRMSRSVRLEYSIIWQLK